VPCSSFLIDLIKSSSSKEAYLNCVEKEISKLFIIETFLNFLACFKFYVKRERKTLNLLNNYIIFFSNFISIKKSFVQLNIK